MAFAGQYGAQRGDGRYQAKYDLNSDGATDFSDFLLFVSSYGNIVPLDGGEPVEIPDGNLRAVISDSLGKARGAPINRADMATLRRIDAGGYPSNNISDLTGLEYATNLTELSLIANQISDISPLSGLTNLTYLDLEGNQISDIAALAGLTNLTHLSLGDNEISDISPLSGLTNLTSLDLSYNPLSATSINTYIPALQSRRVGVGEHRWSL